MTGVPGELNLSEGNTEHKNVKDDVVNGSQLKSKKMRKNKSQGFYTKTFMDFLGKKNIPIQVFLNRSLQLVLRNALLKELFNCLMFNVKTPFNLLCSDTKEKLENYTKLN